MAKRKKGATVPLATRRTTRRGKQAAAEAGIAEGESSTAPEPAVPETPSESPAPSTDDQSTTTKNYQKPTETQTSETSEQCTKLSQVPVIALHKKFGKYRCLLNNDEMFKRKYEIGSDSETNSSIEIRIIDPCASSESDSNMAIDMHGDNNGRACYSPANSTVTSLQSNSRDLSPVTVLQTMTDGECSQVKEADLDDKEETGSISLLADQDQMEDFEHVFSETKEQQEVEAVAVTSEIVSGLENQENQNIPMEEEQLHFTCDDDDEVITVVQIVEDDNPEVYYNIKIDSPQENTVNDHLKNAHDVDFQKDFENLNLIASSDLDGAINCDTNENRTPPCGTPDLQFAKENINEILARPDPSLTPSSILSDDSNSSRVTEQNQNNSNDSAESSPTGVRRSNRIKTISNLKQKTKGYGLVKTPLKKALITQTKLKLEEIGSDSQEKFYEGVPSNAPNSPSFPVPCDMPVKVKSRWRRSSELEMGASSPASSPLASPSLPQRMPALNENQSTLEDEQPFVPLSKEAYDKIIEERMNQYQHLEENEYMCERMISKETKKMICDCFMTKDELERGELACGEDCLNRLLMIEW